MAHPVVGVVQLLLLALFVGSVMYLNTYRPARTHYRPFRIRWWVPTVCGVTLILLLASLLNLPHHLQHTNQLVAGRHAQGRAECQELVEQGAQHAERAVLFASEYFVDRSAAPPPKVGSHTVSELLSPLLNMLLFNSGVTICAVPLLVHLLHLHLRRPAAPTRQSWLDTLRRESGVLLPVLNFISLVSAFTSPTFYLFIQPGRVDRCIYTSGHWFTFSVTLLTFAVILAHLASYQHYCRSSGQLLALFAVWLGVYTMCALSVLKRTQEAFHDSVEAVDGIRQGLPAFAVYMLFFIALQYITFLSTDTDAGDPALPQPQPNADDSMPTTLSDSINSKQRELPAQLPLPSPVTAGQSATEHASPALADVPNAPSPPPPPPPPPAPAMTTTAAPTAPRLTQRKAAAAVPAPIPDSRSAMLDAIKARVPLRPTPNTSARPNTQLTGLAKILSETRKVLQPDGEQDTEQGDSWD